MSQGDEEEQVGRGGEARQAEKSPWRRLRGVYSRGRERRPRGPVQSAAQRVAQRGCATERRRKGGTGEGR